LISVLKTILFISFEFYLGLLLLKGKPIIKITTIEKTK